MKTYSGAKYKDALEPIHGVAYAVGHLANDLVISIWQQYSALYMTETVKLTDYEAGLVVLGGQVVDAIFQPLVSYCSDNIDTPIGKRMPWYIIGNILVLPCFYLFFNPPDSAIGPDIDNPEPNFYYFMIVPSLMLIGQGAIQLSHMSIVNSMSYDQKRRDVLINYRNSCAYIAGVFIPFLSYYIFTNVKEDFDQFSWIANICAILGTITSISFALIVHEPKLIKKSKEIYDKYFFVQQIDPGEKGVDLDKECSDADSYDAPNFGGGQTSRRQKESDQDSVGRLSYNDLSEMFELANKKAHRGTVSVGGRNEMPFFQNQKRSRTPTSSLFGDEMYVPGQGRKTIVGQKFDAAP